MTAAVPGLAAGMARIAAGFDIPGFINSGRMLGMEALRQGGNAAAMFARGFKEKSDQGNWVETAATRGMQKAFQNAERMAAMSGKAVADNFLGGIDAIRSGDPGKSFESATMAVSSFVGVVGNAGQAIADVGSQMEQFGPIAEYVGHAIGIVTTSMQLFIETGGQYLGQIAEIGDVYLQLRRTLAESTLELGQVNAQMALTQEIMASGAVDHFEDVSQSIGRFARSLNIAGPELRDFTETYAAMAELVGSISPTNIAGVLNAYMPSDGIVKATGEVYDYSEQLTRFTNIIRATGGNAQSMVDSMIRVGPAMRALGYDAGGTALFFGSLIEEGLRGQKLVYGMNQIVEKLHDPVRKGQFKDLSAAWGSLLETVKSLQAAGNGNAAIRILSDYTTPANAALLAEAIKKGVIRDASEMGQQAGRDFGQSLSEAASETSSLADIFENVQQQFDAAISPIGLAFDSFIINGGNKLVAWLADNQVQVAEWAANIADFFLAGFQTIIGTIGDLFKGFSEIVNPLVESIGFVMMRILDPFRLTADLIGKMTWLPGSEMFKAFGDGMNGVNDALGKMRDMDLSKPIREAGEYLDKLPGKIGNVREALPAALDEFRRSLSVEQALKIPLLDEKGQPVLDAIGNPDYQNAYAQFDGFRKDEKGNPLKDAQGRTIPIDPYAPMIPIRKEAADKIREQLKALNIEIALDATGTMITQVRAADDEARRAWEAWISSRTTKKLDVQPNPIGKNGETLSAISDMLPGGELEVKLTPNDADIQAYIRNNGLVAPGAMPTYGPGGVAYSGLAPGTIYGLPSNVTRPAILKDQEGVQSSPASIYAAAAVARNFPRITEIGGGRKSNTAPNTHDIGQSIDIAIPWVNGQLDMAYGDQINEYLKANAESLNIEYTMWRVKDHFDHIDVHFKDGGVAQIRPGAPVQINTPGSTPYAAPTTPYAVPALPGPAAPAAAASGSNLQQWLYQKLLANGLTDDQAKGILAMNSVEGGASDPKSLLGFTESQAPGPEAHVAAFMKQWNDMSRRGPGGSIPGIDATGRVTDWDQYLTWIRVKIVGQVGVKSDWQGNAQPNPQDYQNRLVEALRSGGSFTPWNASAWPAGTTPAFIPQPQVPAAMPAVPVGPAPGPTVPMPGVPAAATLPAPASPIPPAAPTPAGPAPGPDPKVPISVEWKPDATGNYLYYQGEDGKTFFVDKKVPTLPPVPDKGNFGNTAGGHWRWIDHGGSKYWLFSPDPANADGTTSGGATGQPPAPAGPPKPPEPKPEEKPAPVQLPGKQPGDPIYESTKAAEKWVRENYDGKVPAPVPGTLTNAPFDWTKGTPVPPKGMEYNKDGKIVKQFFSDDQQSGMGAIGRFFSGLGNMFATGTSNLHFGGEEYDRDKDYARPQVLIPAIGRAIANSKGAKQIASGASWLWENLTPFATGGEVWGAGTATSDSIPAWLSNGEFVQNAAAVDHYGVDFMHAINQRKLPKFNTGGAVSDGPSPSSSLGDLLVPKGSNSLQDWLRGKLTASGFTDDQIRGILAMNAVEGGATDPRSVLGFTDSQFKGPEAKFNAFLNQQWNDTSRRPGGKIPGLDANGNVTNWSDYMAWLRVKIVGQTGLKSDWEGNAQPPAEDYQRRLMQALVGGAQRPLGFDDGGLVPNGGKNLQKELLRAAFLGKAEMPQPTNALGGVGNFLANDPGQTMGWKEKLSKSVANVFSGSFWLDKAGVDTNTEGWTKKQAYIFGLSEAMGALNLIAGGGNSDPVLFSGKDLIDFFAMPDALKEIDTIGSDKSTLGQKGLSLLAMSAFVPGLGKIGGKLADAGKAAPAADNLLDAIRSQPGFTPATFNADEIAGIRDLAGPARDEIIDVASTILGATGKRNFKSFGVFDVENGPYAGFDPADGSLQVNKFWWRDLPAMDEALNIDGQNFWSPLPGGDVSPQGQVIGHELFHSTHSLSSFNPVNIEFALRNAFIDLNPDLGFQPLRSLSETVATGGYGFPPEAEKMFQDWVGVNTFGYGLVRDFDPARGMYPILQDGEPIHRALNRIEMPPTQMEDVLINWQSASDVSKAIYTEFKRSQGLTGLPDLAPYKSRIDAAFEPGLDAKDIWSDWAGGIDEPTLNDSLAVLFNLADGNGMARKPSSDVWRPYGTGSRPKVDASLPAGPISTAPKPTAEQVMALLGDTRTGPLSGSQVSRISPEAIKGLREMFDNADWLTPEVASEIASNRWPFSQGFNPFDDEMLEAIRRYTGANTPFYDLSYMDEIGVKQAIRSARDRSYRSEMAGYIDALDAAIEGAPAVGPGGMMVTRAMGNSWRAGARGPAGSLIGTRNVTPGYQSVSPGMGDVTPWVRDTMAHIFLPEGTKGLYISTPDEGLPGLTDRMSYDPNGTTLSIYPNQNEMILPRYTGLSVVNELPKVPVEEYFERLADRLGIDPNVLTGQEALANSFGTRSVKEVWMVADQPSEIPPSIYELMQGKPVEGMPAAPTGGSFGMGNDVPPFATGGEVWGPGTGTSDSIAAWLSNGEFVHNAAAVDYYGTDFMHAVNGMKLPKFAPGGPVGDPAYPTPASQRPAVGGGEPLPYELANYRGQYDSGPGSQFQSGPENNPFIFIPLGPKMPYEEALKLITDYVSWQEQKYEVMIKQPQELRTSLDKFTESYNKAIEASVTANLNLQNILDQQAKDMAALKPGQDPTITKNFYDEKIKSARGDADVKAKAVITEQQNYINAVEALGKNRADALALETQGPPAPESKKKKVKADKDAESLGAGLVQGILQELGFPDVFGDSIFDWGIWKKGMGLLGFGMQMAQNAGILGAPNSNVNLGLGPGTAQSVVGGALQNVAPGVSSIPGVNPIPATSVPTVAPASSVTPQMSPAAPDPLTQTGGSGPAPGPGGLFQLNIAGNVVDTNTLNPVINNVIGAVAAPAMAAPLPAG